MAGTYNAGIARAKYELEARAAEESQKRLTAGYVALAKAQAQAFAGARPAGAAAPVTAEEVKLAQALARTAEAEARRANATARRTEADARAARATAQAGLAEQKEQTEAARTAAAQDRAAIAALRRAQAEQQAARAQQQEAQASRQQTGSAQASTNGLLNIAKGYLTIQAAQRGFSFLKAGAEAADAAKSFTNLAGAAGTTDKALLASLHAAADGTITDANLVKSANLGLLLTQGRIAKDLPQLIAISRAAAKSTGQDIDFVYDSLVRGIARGSPKIIDNAGITLDAEKAFEEYARSIGKTADQLTKDEQQQATLNAVLKDGAEIVKTVGLNADDASVKLARAETAAKNLGTTLIQKVAPYVATGLQGTANLIDTGTVDPAARAGGDEITGKLARRAQSYEEYAQGVDKANQQLKQSYGGVRGFVVDAFFGIDKLSEQQYAYVQSLEKRGVAEGRAAQQARELGDVDRAFAGALEDSLARKDGSAQALTALSDKFFDVASASDSGREAVVALLNAYLNAGPNIGQVKLAIEGLANSQEKARQAALEEEHEQRRLTGAHIDGKNAAVLAAEAQQKAIDASVLEAAQTAELNDKKEQLNATAKFTAQSLLDAGDSGAKAAAQLALSSSDVDKATAAYYRLLAAQQAISKEPIDPGRGERDTPADRAAAAAAGAQAARERQAAAAQARIDQLLRTGSAQQIVAERQREYNEAVRQFGKDSKQAIDAQTNLIEARKSAAKAADSAGGKGLSALEKSDLDLITDYRARLAEVNAKLERGNLTALQRNQLEKERLDLQNKINDAVAKQRDLAVDLALAEVHDAQDRLKEAREAAGLERAVARGRLSAEQSAAVQLRLQEIALEQQKRANDIDDKRREAAKLEGQVGPAVPATAQAQIDAARTAQGQQAAAAPLGVPLGPVGTLAQLPLPPSFAPPPITLNVSIIIDKNGTPIVQAPPGIDLNVLLGASRAANAAGGRG